MGTYEYRVVVDSWDKQVGSKVDYRRVVNIDTYGTNNGLIGTINELNVVDSPNDSSITLLIGTLNLIERFADAFESFYNGDNVGLAISVNSKPNTIYPHVHAKLAYVNETAYECFKNGERIFSKLFKDEAPVGYDDKFLTLVGKLILDEDEDEMEKLLSKKKLAMNLNKANKFRLTKEIEYLNTVLDNLKSKRTLLINSVQSLV